MKNLTPILILFCSLVFQNNLNAVSGTVTVDSTWSGTVLITGNIAVNQYVTLTIQPGTNIKFSGNYTITINGALNASGTSANKIVFTSNQATPAPGNWGGISFTSLSGYITSTISNCEFYYATNALGFTNVLFDYTMNVSSCLFDNISGDAVNVNNSHVIINACTIRNFGGNGIYAIGTNANVSVNNSQITQELPTRIRTASGIYGITGATMTLTGNTLSRCSYGVYARSINQDVPVFNVSHNNISDNNIGVFITPYTGGPYPQITATNNNIYSNIAHNVSVNVGINPRSTELDFRDNWWGSSNGVTIASKIYDYSSSADRAFVNFLPFLNAPFDQGGSSTSGNYKAGLIHQNTTWTLANSPYIVIGKIVVEEKTLTIEPGVEIRFQSGGIEVDGALNASGTSANKIVFTSNQATPAPGNWGGISFTSLSGYITSTISNCEFYYATNALGFTNVLFDYTMNVSSCLFDNISGDAVNVNNSHVIINACTIRNFGGNGIYAIGTNANVSVNNSQITQELPTRIRTASGIYGITGATMTLTGNTLSRCSYGVYARSINQDVPVFNVSHNNISDNNIGVFITPYTGGPYPQITATNNNIYSNIAHNVSVNVGINPRSTELDFRDNWWGSSNGVTIASKIYDYSSSADRAFVNFLPFLNAPFDQGGSSTSGNYKAGLIHQNTTWTLANSPYIVIGKIVVEEKTLTIEPGVEIRFQSGGIEVDGALNASGTSANKIVFTSNQATPAPGNWGGISFTSLSGYITSTISNCEFYYATNALGFTNVLFDYTMNVSSCLFDNISGDAVNVNNSHVIINACTIRNFGGNGIYATGTNANVSVNNSQITQELPTRIRTANGIYGITGATMTLTGNTLSRCSYGVYARSINQDVPVFNVSHNNISDNNIGVFITPYTGGPYPQITATNNNIYSNIAHNVSVNVGINPRSTELDFRDNWWGSSNGVTIASKIYDYSSSADRAFVNFLPFLNAPFDQGGNSTSGNYKAGLIHQNTTWTLANSPYIIIGEIIVEQIKTLTIEPGVEVRFQSDGITVDGALVAKGTTSKKIVFTSNLTEPQPGNYTGITITSLTGSPVSSFSYCDFQYAATALKFSNISALYSNDVSNSVFNNISNTALYIEGSTVGINSCTIKNFGSYGIYATGDNVLLSVNDCGISQQLPAKINTASGVYGVNGAKVTLTGNTIEKCQYGIFPQTTGSLYPVFNMTNNSIIENKTGVYVYAYSSGNRTYPTVIAHNNDIHTNIDWNVVIGAGANPSTTQIDFKSNYWKLVDSASVKSKIYDFSNSATCAKVLFVPFATTTKGLYGIADINKDGRTDGLDLALLAASFGLYSANPGYNPSSDVNNSGRVDGFDLAILGINFGTWGHGAPAKGQPAYNENEQIDFVADADWESLNEGDSISYKISANNAESIYAFGLTIGYDDNIMELLSISDGGLLSHNSNDKIVLLQNNKTNSVYTAISRIGSPKELNENTGEILVITFKLKTSAKSLPGIKLDNLEVTDDNGSTEVSFNLFNNINSDVNPPENLLRIFPNPVIDAATIEYTVLNDNKITMCIYDSGGRLVKKLLDYQATSGVYNQRFAIGNMSSGAYTCILKQGDTISRSRIIVLK